MQSMKRAVSLSPAHRSCAHNEVAYSVLNKALMNLSSSRLGSEVDRTRCGDCQASTWDGCAASGACAADGLAADSAMTGWCLQRSAICSLLQRESLVNMCSCLSACH